MTPVTQAVSGALFVCRSADETSTIDCWAKRPLGTAPAACVTASARNPKGRFVMDSGDGYRRCTKCKQDLPATREHFHVNKYVKSGLHSRCKACVSEYNRERYRKKREKILTYNRAYYWEHLEQERKRHRRWHHENREAVRRRKRKYYQKNKKRFRKNLRQWRKRNREKFREQCRRRYARESNASGDYTLAEFEQLCAEYDHCCVACGRVGVDLTADHVIPLSRGGSNDISNVQPLCQSCNSRKGTETTDYRTKPCVKRWIQKSLFS